jgi:hypothetical protein
MGRLDKRNDQSIAVPEIRFRPERQQVSQVTGDHHGTGRFLSLGRRSAARPD